MLRFLTIKDVHLRDHNPRSRIDDYCEEVFNKLDQIGQLAEHFKCSAVLLAGDLIHFKAPTKTSHKLVNRLQRRFRSFPCPVVGILGNHDIQYDDLTEYMKQPVGSLIESGALILLDDNTQFFHDEKQNIVVSIHGKSWDRKHNVEHLVAHDRPPNVDFMIAVVHALLDPQGSNFYGEQCVSYNAVATNLKADAVVCGHIHTDSGIQEVMGKWFINTGAVSRGSIHDDNIVRKVNTCLISVDRDDSGKVEWYFHDIKLRTENADDIFDIRKHMAEKEENVLLEQFVDQLSQQSLVIKADDLRDVIGSMEDFEKVVRDKALQYLADATHL